MRSRPVGPVDGLDGQSFTGFHTPLWEARMIEPYRAPAAVSASSWECTYVAMVNEAVA